VSVVFVFVSKAGIVEENRGENYGGAFDYQAQADSTELYTDVFILQTLLGLNRRMIPSRKEGEREREIALVDVCQGLTCCSLASSLACRENVELESYSTI